MKVKGEYLRGFKGNNLNLNTINSLIFESIVMAREKLTLSNFALKKIKQ